MSYFAKIENDKVVQVIRAEQNFITRLDGEWIQTSYNTRGGKHYNPETGEEDGTGLRYNYAGVGFTYDASRDAFIKPKLEDSTTYVFNEDKCGWERPHTPPDDGNLYVWDEAVYQSDNSKGWVLFE